MNPSPRHPRSRSGSYTESYLSDATALTGLFRGPTRVFEGSSGKFDRVQTARLWGAAAISAALVTATVSGCTEKPTNETPSTLATSTTKIASAGVLGNARKPDESCAKDAAAVDPSAPREVRHAQGETEVPEDAKRIVVLDAGAIDTLCALGLQDRIVGVALADQAAAPPSYLGTTVHNLPSIGPMASPDLAKIGAAKPDLILSSAGEQNSYLDLSAIAPTVIVSGHDLAEHVRLVGKATRRTADTDKLWTGFVDAAKKVGRENDAAHFQASIVQFTDQTVRVYGANNFPASVLATVGLDRPATQRFTDKPFIEIGTEDFSAAEGDIIYVSFTSSSAKDRAARIFGSKPWMALGATRDNRVFAVNNEVWQTGDGIVAGRGILDDLQWVNAPIN
ncbi:putative FeIII-dicitrate-binding periplasmic lipoprotein [Mycobacteroides abscessus subsp. abscessus]|nr:putative FeIII-dicitrate-binding periplasmic lipoprotein [Mycobacteroides abscessus subsp. abscessus]